MLRMRLSESCAAVEVKPLSRLNWITALLLSCFARKTNVSTDFFFHCGHFNDFCHATMQSEKDVSLAQEKSSS